MAHLFFIVLHIMMVIFGVVGLVITIPLHIIYGVIKSNERKQRAQIAQIAHAQGVEIPPEKMGFALKGVLAAGFLVLALMAIGAGSMLLQTN